MGNFLSSQEQSHAHTHSQTEQFANSAVGQQSVYDYTQTQRYQRQADDYRRQIDDLIRENKALKHYNQALRNETHKLNQKMETLSNQMKEAHHTEREPIKASISTEHIKQYVDEMLKNSDINIYGFPDAIEKQIYRNVFNMLLNVLDHTLDTSEVKLFGHKIVFDIQPLSSPNEVTAQATVELPNHQEQ